MLCCDLVKKPNSMLLVAAFQSCRPGSLHLPSYKPIAVRLQTLSFCAALAAWPRNPTACPNGCFSRLASVLGGRWPGNLGALFFHLRPLEVIHDYIQSLLECIFRAGDLVEASRQLCNSHPCSFIAPMHAFSLSLTIRTTEGKCCTGIKAPLHTNLGNEATLVPAWRKKRCTMHEKRCTMHEKKCTMHEKRCTMHEKRCTMH